MNRALVPLCFVVGLAACDEPAAPAPAPREAAPAAPAEPVPTEPAPAEPVPTQPAEPELEPELEAPPPPAPRVDGDYLPGEDDTPIAMLKLRIPATGSRNTTADLMLKDRLESTLDLNATVGGVNAALEETGARICGFVRAIPQRARLCIPEVQSAAEARALANRLMAHRAFVHAAPIFIAGERSSVR